MTEEAEDNVRFLGTLERHLRVIAAEAADPVQLFDAVTATLGPLLASLRLVWVLSIHYSDDATMGALLQNISLQIGGPLFNRSLCSRWKAALRADRNRRELSAHSDRAL